MTVKRIGWLGIVLLATVVMVYGALAWLGYLPRVGGQLAVVTAAPSLGSTGVPPSPVPTGTAPAPTLTAPALTGSPNGGAASWLVGAGDIADCSSPGDEATAALLDDIEGTVFTLGDNAYERGTRTEFARCYEPTWGRHRSRTRPVAGNHEYETPGAAGYFGYFGTAAGDPNRGWYAYDAGAWRVYVLNSNCADVGGCDAGSRQESWLRADLAANPRACTLAMWHHPRFSSGEHGNDAATAALWRALYGSGAELILVGHDHLYERFAPQTADGTRDDKRGIVEIVVGTGGRGLYSFEHIRDNSLVRDNETWGVLRLALLAGSYTFEFVPVSGSTFTDGGSGTCH